MTGDRCSRWLSFVGVSCLLLVGSHNVASPYLTAAVAQAPDPTPTPQPEPKPDPPKPEPTVGIAGWPEKVAPGDALVAECCLKAAESQAQYLYRLWVVVGPEGAMRRAPESQIHPLDEGRRIVVGTLEGNYLLECFGDGGKGIEYYSVERTIGKPAPPAPPTPLVDLAGADAYALSLAYTDLAGVVGIPELTPTSGIVRQNAAAMLKRHAVDASPAVAAVNSRYLDPSLGKDETPVDDVSRPVIVAKIQEVINELGARPPPPGPGPGPAPITDTGLRVLIVYDVNGKARLPREQMALLDSPTLRAYLDAHCTKNGTVPEWRIVPTDTVFNADQPIWQKLMAQPRAGDNWLVVTNGKGAESVALPANEDAALALIGKYAQ